MAGLRGQIMAFRVAWANPPRPGALPWLALTIAVLALDQWSKHWAEATLQFRQPVPVIEGFWNWTLTYNTGAAFSFLADAGGWQRWFFAGLAFAVSASMLAWLRLTPRGDWRNALPASLIIAGAIGNVVDRLRFGHVVDFVDWYYGSYHWPAFNVADAAIVGGAIGLVLFSFSPARPAGKGG